MTGHHNGIGHGHGPHGGPGLPNLLGNGGNGRLNLDPLGLFQRFSDQGLSPGSAFNNTVGQGDPGIGGPHHHGPSSPNAPTPPPLNPEAVGRTFDALPPDIQHSILRDAGALTAPVREALSQLGVTQAPSHPDVTQTVATTAAALGDTVSRAADVSHAAANAVQGTGGNLAAEGASALVANAFAVREPANPQQVLQGNPQGGRGERAAGDTAAANPLAARADGLVAGRAVDVPGGVVLADRFNATQQQNPAQQAPPGNPQGRTDAAAAQTLAMFAGATMLAAPQGNPALAQSPTLAAPVPPGTDAAAAQARESQLAPAGHTISGFLRRDLRKGTQPQRDAATPQGATAGLLAALRKRNGEDAPPVNRFLQAAFWMLTTVAYGAVVVAAVAMVFGGQGLTDVNGDPSSAGYALIVGTVAAFASWFVGRRLAR